MAGEPRTHKMVTDFSVTGGGRDSCVCECPNSLRDLATTPSTPGLDVERLARAIEVQEAGSDHPTPLLTAWSQSGDYWLTNREVAERIAAEYVALTSTEGE